MVIIQEGSQVCLAAAVDCAAGGWEPCEESRHLKTLAKPCSHPSVTPNIALCQLAPVFQDFVEMFLHTLFLFHTKYCFYLKCRELGDVNLCISLRMPSCQSTTIEWVNSVNVLSHSPSCQESEVLAALVSFPAVGEDLPSLFLGSGGFLTSCGILHLVLHFSWLSLNLSFLGGH